MENEEDRTRKDLILKEEQLLENNTRCDSTKIAELIGDNCIEFTATGKQNNYHPGEMFGNVDGVLYIDSNTVKLVHLSDDCKLLMYIAAKVNKNARMKSNHSSIWKKTNGKWKMIFHQATNCAE